MHAILSSLEAKGYVAREAGGRGFTLGPGLVPLGTVASKTNPAIAAASREADRITEEYDVECVVAAPAGEEILIVHHSGVQRARGITAEVGQRLPLVPPMGGVFMAWRSREEVSAWLGRVEGDDRRLDASGYLAELDRIRERGYALGYMVDAVEDLNDLYRNSNVELHTSIPRRKLAEIFSALERERYIDADSQKERSINYLAVPVFDAVARLVCNITLLPGANYGVSDVPELSSVLLRGAASVMREISGRRPDVTYLS